MYPDAPLIQRQGEVNAWDNEDFRAAIKATNKSQIIMAGIVTDVCEFTTPHQPLPPPMPIIHRLTPPHTEDHCVANT